MPGDETGITLTLTYDRSSGQGVASWSDARPAGTIYQVYVDRRLYAWTAARRIALPVGAGRRIVQVCVAPAGGPASYDPPDVPAGLGTGGNVLLAWQGGAGPVVGGRKAAAYAIWRGSAPGVAAVASGSPTATVPAGPVPGWAAGGWAAGGWASGLRDYRWRDPASLAAGTWHYALAAVDESGRVGTAAAPTADVVSPPRSATRDGSDPFGRVVYVDDANPAAPVLRWGHSPDWTAPPAAQNEIQRLTANGTGGTLTLGYDAGSVLLFHGDSAATVQSALEGGIAALSGNIVVTGGTLGSADLIFEFVNALGNQDITLGLSVVGTTGTWSPTPTITVDQEGSS